MIFGFVDGEKANHAVAMLCRVLGVSTSGYYQWRTRRPSRRECTDAFLTHKIKRIHSLSRGTYGAPRVHVETQRGSRHPLRGKRVARLMRPAGIQGCHRRRRHWTTQRNREAIPAPDLVNRNFSAVEPNRLWTADVERHEALLDRVELGGLRPWAVAAAPEKLGAA